MKENERKAYLTFSLGKENFAINVDKVKEILELSTVTEIPQSPNYMRGIVNLRGSVLPIIDTRTKFGLSSVEDTLKTRIIVLQITVNDEEMTVGSIVDKASEVINISPTEILPAPQVDEYERAEFISGIIKRNEEFIMLLDVQKLFGSEVYESLESINESI